MVVVAAAVAAAVVAAAVVVGRGRKVCTEPRHSDLALDVVIGLHLLEELED